MSARLDHLEREDRRSMQTQRAFEGRQRGLAWARSVGFSEREAPFAVLAAEVIKCATHGKPVTKAQVVEQMRAAYPWLGQ